MPWSSCQPRISPKSAAGIERFATNVGDLAEVACGRR
jgi:hypothetical protein